ncbi:hypothetical protein JV59_29275 [Vibrio coralliilyticus]|nr:hypothetical protein JV59_29275 [Vibrio coralliilyticus]
MTINYILELLEYGELEINERTEYGEDWTVEQKQAFVQSMLLGFPVSMFIFVEHENNNYKVVDGAKRLRALRGYFNNDFAVSFSGDEPLFFQYLDRRQTRHIRETELKVSVNEFPDPLDAIAFEKRLHADFEILAKKVVVVERTLSFSSDKYVAALMMIAEFNDYLAIAYPDEIISIKVQQEGDLIRLIVETDKESKIDSQQFLDEFNKSKYGKLFEERLRKSSKDTNPAVNVNVHNESHVNTTVNVDVNIQLQNLLNENGGLLNELIEEIGDNPNLIKDLQKIISSSEKITGKEELGKSSFLHRLTRFVEQAKDKGSALYSISKTSVECAELIKKIIDNFDKISNLL